MIFNLFILSIFIHILARKPLIMIFSLFIFIHISVIKSPFFDLFFTFIHSSEHTCNFSPSCNIVDSLVFLLFSSLIFLIFPLFFLSPLLLLLLLFFNVFHFSLLSVFYLVVPSSLFKSPFLSSSFFSPPFHFVFILPYLNFLCFQFAS